MSFLPAGLTSIPILHVPIKLTRKERRHLDRFFRETRDKREYARGTAILMRWRGKTAREVAEQLNVSDRAVLKWERVYRRLGVDGLRRKASGRPAVKKPAARRLIPGLMKKDPQAFGFLKGRWVVRDISKALKEERVDISPTQVHGVLSNLGVSYKRPKLDVKSDDPSYARKSARSGATSRWLLPSKKGGPRSIRGRDLALALPEGRGGVDASRGAEEGPHPGLQQA